MRQRNKHNENKQKKPNRRPAESVSSKKTKAAKKEKGLSDFGRHAEKPFIIHTAVNPCESSPALPDNYGDNHIFLMVRDPYWIHAYWEIQNDCREEGLSKLSAKCDEVSTILRVYKVAANESSNYFDIPLYVLTKNWYVDVEPNQSYVIEIGLLHLDGRFFCLARSNEVTTPRAGMSEIIDEQWMGIDFEKMYALSGGFEVGKSSQELRKLMEERLLKSISSGSGAGASPVRK